MIIIWLYTYIMAIIIRLRIFHIVDFNQMYIIEFDMEHIVFEKKF